MHRKMRILVAAAFEAGSQHAHTINTVNMARGFAALGHEVTIICRQPQTGKLDPSDVAAAYGLDESVKWIQMPSKIAGRRIGRYWDFAVLSLPALLISRPSLVYARNYTFPFLTSLIGIPTVAETHAHPDNRIKPFLRLIKGTRHKSLRLLVTISQHLADAYKSLGVPPDKIAVLPDAVDMRQFSRPEKLPPNPYETNGPVVAYAGHLYDSKGIPTVLEASNLLPEVQFHFVGGFPEDIERHKTRVRSLGLSNVFFHGMVPYNEVPPYLWHADILLLPPSANHPSAQWTSPVKLGEYLASGTPVVATSIPALKDWLTDKVVKFVPPDDPQALAESIKALLDSPDYCKSISRSAKARAADFSITERVGKILEGALCFSK